MVLWYNENKKRGEKMILSALPYVPNKKVVKDLGMIFAYDDSIRMFRGTFGLMDLQDSVEKAKERLAEEATKMGADAVLGISFDLRDVTKIILMGSAVILEDEE